MAKPIVDGLESDLEGRARVVRLNVLDSVGMQLARRLGVRALPTFVVFDGRGKAMETYIGLPNRAKIRAQTETLLTP